MAKLIIALTLYQQGLKCLEEKNLSLALSLFQSAIKLAPKESAFYISLGKTYQLLKDMDNALKAYEKALELNPYNPSALFGIGVIKSKQGDTKAAESYFEEARLALSKAKHNLLRV